MWADSIKKLYNCYIFFVDIVVVIVVVHVVVVHLSLEIIYHLPFDFLPIPRTGWDYFNIPQGMQAMAQTDKHTDRMAETSQVKIAFHTILELRLGTVSRMNKRTDKVKTSLCLFHNFIYNKS